VLPVTRFEGEAIGEGQPGPWTARARADREAYIQGDGLGHGASPPPASADDLSGQGAG
jgi:hypothetical protein